jgi:hypothetical protein
MDVHSVGRIALLLSSAALACIEGKRAPGYPLYENGGKRLPLASVATLTQSLPVGVAPGGGGKPFIKTVDGRPVGGHGSTFELLPGCHVVETEASVHVANENMSWSGQLGTHVFALKMRAGHAYTVELGFSEQTGGSAKLSVATVERDPSGRNVAVLESAKSDEDVRACLAWQPDAP